MCESRHLAHIVDARYNSSTMIQRTFANFLKSIHACLFQQNPGFRSSAVPHCLTPMEDASAVPGSIVMTAAAVGPLPMQGNTHSRGARCLPWSTEVCWPWNIPCGTRDSPPSLPSSQ